ncbi:acidic mammalian chitinase, partial [Biomphalaria glabrata]
AGCLALGPCCTDETGVAGTDAVCWWAGVVDPGSGCSPTMYSCRDQLRLPFSQASDESVASVVAWTLMKI